MRRDIARALKAIGTQRVKLESDGSLRLAPPNATKALRVDAKVASHMISEGLLERVRGEVVRTDAGRAFLRRTLCAMEDEPFVAQQRVLTPRSVRTTSGAEQVVTNAGESPLGWLATRRDKHGTPMISAEQFEAGRRLAMEYDRGHQRQSVTQSWNMSGVRGSSRAEGLSITEAAEDARRRVDRALGAVGPGLSDVLLAVCCEELGLEAAERRMGWPARSGKVVLRLALDRLAQHYGIGGVATGAERAPMRHWGTPDYCPSA